jgi:hypothetical protein
VRSAARGEEDLLGNVARLDGDVHGAVAHPDHDDPLPLEVVGVTVEVRVHLDAAQGAGKGRLGPARVPVVAVGHNQGVVTAGLRAGRAGEVDLPHPIRPALGALDPVSKRIRLRRAK